MKSKFEVNNFTIEKYFEYVGLKNFCPSPLSIKYLTNLVRKFRLNASDYYNGLYIDICEN